MKVKYIFYPRGVISWLEISCPLYFPFLVWFVKRANKKRTSVIFEQKNSTQFANLWHTAKSNWIIYLFDSSTAITG